MTPFPSRTALLVALLVAVLSTTGCGSDGRGPLQVGVATAALDAPIGVSMGGFGRSKKSDDPGSPLASGLPATIGVHTAPMVKALALTNGQARVALARVDLALATATLRARTMAKLTDLKTFSLIISATHTHAAPGGYILPIPVGGGGGFDVASRIMDNYNPEIEDRLADSIAEAVRAAFANMRPAAMGFSETDASAFNRDRRCENDSIYGPDYRDTTATLLRFDEVDAAGKVTKPIAALLHYAVHGTGLGADNKLISVDVPGAMELYASDALSVPVLFLQGAAGDVGPHSGTFGHDGTQGLERIGRLAAPIIAAAFDAAAPGKATPVTLEYVERALSVTRAGLGYRAGEFPEHGGLPCLFDEDNCNHRTDPAKITCLPIVKGRAAESVVSALWLGDVMLALIPGEPTTGVQARLLEQLKPRAKSAHVLVSGYAQDHGGYMLEDEDFLHGGYEPSFSPWGWKYGEFVISSVVALVDARQKKEAQPKPPTLELEPATRSQPSQSTGPAKIVNSSGDMERLKTATLQFEAGDSLLGTPQVSLEREENGAFSPVAASPTRFVVNGPEIIVRYSAFPTYAADKTATVRTHTWKAEWETLQTTPLGRYRLVATGKTIFQGAVTDFRLEGQPFTLTASGAVGTNARATFDGGTLAVELRYPSNPVQIVNGSPSGNYRLRDAFSTMAEGALARDGSVKANVRFPDGTSKDVTFNYDAAANAHVAKLDSATSGSYQVSVAAGEAKDGEGNFNAQALSLTAVAQ